LFVEQAFRLPEAASAKAGHVDVSRIACSGNSLKNASVHTGVSAPKKLSVKQAFRLTGVPVFV
jgi:hypothetical protein